MKKEISQLVNRAMDFYGNNKMVMELNIAFVNSNSPMQVSKGIYDIAWLMSKRDLKMCPIVEGETVAVNRCFDIDKDMEIVFPKIMNFLNGKSLPVRLNVLIEAKSGKFDIVLVEFK